MKRLLLGALLLAIGSTGTGGETPGPGQGFVDVPGGPVWYRVVGTGPGIPILALHGGPGGTSCGYTLLEALGDRRPLIRYDQLGTGRSGRPEDLSLWTVERFVAELHVLREKLGLEQLHLLGHSWGASLAAAYVLDKGSDGIVSVVLSSPLLSTPLWIDDANYLRSQLPDDVQRTLSEHEAAGTTDSDAYVAASAVFYERHMYAGEPMSRPASCESAPWSKFIYEHMWGPSEFHADGTLVDFDVTDRLHEIDVPVLFVTGEFDEARPETVAGFHKLVPDSQFEVIPDVGHASYGKKPEQYMAILEDFFANAERKK